MLPLNLTLSALQALFDWFAYLLIYVSWCVWGPCLLSQIFTQEVSSLCVGEDDRTRASDRGPCFTQAASQAGRKGFLWSGTCLGPRCADPQPMCAWGGYAGAAEVWPQTAALSTQHPEGRQVCQVPHESGDGSWWQDNAAQLLLYQLQVGWTQSHTMTSPQFQVEFWFKYYNTRV